MGLVQKILLPTINVVLLSQIEILSGMQVVEVVVGYIEGLIIVSTQTGTPNNLL